MDIQQGHREVPDPNTTSPNPPAGVPRPLPDESDPQVRRQIIERACASSKLEGFVPDESDVAAAMDYIRGRATLEGLLARLDAEHGVR
ncbi:hypothetical protein [Microbacterium sp. CR_7]|uniref:antitoxin VbhA family protein n=1 Tax=Microbacterium sp. CR_7 TaxID=3055792 RepID=UPI0035C0EC0F